MSEPLTPEQRFALAIQFKNGCPWECKEAYTAGVNKSSPRLQYVNDCETIALKYFDAIVELDRLRAEREKDREDAERWRHQRENGFCEVVYDEFIGCGNYNTIRLKTEGADKAVDAARAKEKGNN